MLIWKLYKANVETIISVFGGNETEFLARFDADSNGQIDYKELEGLMSTIAGEEVIHVMS